MNEINLFLLHGNEQYNCFFDYLNFLRRLFESNDIIINIYIITIELKILKIYFEQNYIDNLTNNNHIYNRIYNEDKPKFKHIREINSNVLCNIIIPAEIFTENYEVINENIIKKYKLENILCFNTEQLSRKQERITNFINLTKKNIKILDYSEEHYHILNNNNISSFVLPYLFNYYDLYYNDINISLEENIKTKIYDICMIGNNSERRINLQMDINNKGLDIKNILGWMSNRDRIVFRNKILVNCHYEEDYKIIEQIRINRCIFNKMIVISEEGKYHDDIYLSKYIIFCKYEDIADKVKEVYDNYYYYVNLIYKDFDINEVINYQNNIVKNFIEYIKS